MGKKVLQSHSHRIAKNYRIFKQFPTKIPGNQAKFQGFPDSFRSKSRPATGFAGLVKTYNRSRKIKKIFEIPKNPSA